MKCARCRPGRNAAWPSSATRTCASATSSSATASRRSRGRYRAHPSPLVGEGALWLCQRADEGYLTAALAHSSGARLISGPAVPRSPPPHFAKQCLIAAGVLDGIAHWLAIHHRIPESRKLPDIGLLEAAAYERPLVPVAFRAMDDQLRLLVIQIGRGKEQLEQPIVEREGDPLAVVGEVRHHQMNHVPFGAPALQADGARAAVAAGKDGGADHLSASDAERVEQ